MDVQSLAPDLVTFDPDGRVKVAFHPGQLEAWDADERFVFVFAGTQGGKTSFVPWWLNREIDQTADINGNNDYLAVTATYDLFKLKLLPEMRRVFEFLLHRARFWAASKVLELCDPEGRFWAANADAPMWGRIILRSAQSQGGLESATAKAAVLDECGQDAFTLDDWEAVQRRLSLAQGRVLGATTIYNLGWVKSQIYDPWRAGTKNIRVVQFPSYLNPAFPKEEYERIAAIMPKWKVNMFYRGVFDVPEGLIYSAFDFDAHTIDPFPIPEDWPCYIGVDFGGVHTAAVIFREDPATEKLYLTHEYLEGRRTSKEHADALKEHKPKFAVGGAGSEDQWRMEFGAAGFPIREPLISEVEVGIDRVYAQHTNGAIMVFRSCRRYLDEKGTYSRELDKAGQPTEKIADKNTYHLMDAERYIISTIRARTGKVKVRRMSDA